MRAGLLGALAATAVGTLANDSGALLLESATAYLLVFAGFAWAESATRRGPGPVDDLPLVARANRPRLAIFLELPGRREPARRGARRGVPRPWPPRPRARPLRPARPAQPGRSTGRRPSRARCPTTWSPLGRTVGFAANGAVSNLAPFPAGGVVAPAASCAAGDFDVIHVHEPVVPLVGWNAALGADAPAVGTFHAYSTKAIPNHIASALGARRVFNRLSARIAVSEAAAWTGRRWFGGDYEIVPNGVDVDAAPQRAEAARRRAAHALRRPPRGAQGPAGPAHRLRRPGRARALPADRDRRRARGRAALSRRPRADALDRRPRAGLRRAASGARCTTPTCSARPRSPARASAWS